MPLSFRASVPLSFRAKFRPPLGGGWNAVEEPAVWPAKSRFLDSARNDNAKFAGEYVGARVPARAGVNEKC